jgi:phenylacetate-CoA ligase
MRKYLIFSFVIVARYFREVLSASESSHKLFFTPGFETFRWEVSKWKVWYVYETAKRTVPAYKQFIGKRKPKIKLSGLNPDLSSIPITNKENYVKKFSLEERCVDGKLPMRGAVIDESSGTSGTPNNWVRGPLERQATKRLIQMGMHNIVGNKQFFLINAFALGPWATGMNVSMSTIDIAIIKSTGPDVQKIVNTLNLFGPKYHYVICGYPPFLKNLVDSQEVKWKDFKITTFYGGEGISEATRNYLLQYFTNVYGSYGASDLEINIAAENNFTIELRREIADNPLLATELTKNYGVLPMVFQYNPLDYYIESIETGELVISLARASNIAPKIRYNIHDLGHVLRMPEYLKIMKKMGVRNQKLLNPPHDLPILFHYGRSDAAVGFYGCKITPAEIEAILYSYNELKNDLASFSLITFEDEDHNKHLTLALEMLEGRTLPEDSMVSTWCEHIFNQLAKVNQDFSESSRMVPESCKPTIECHEHLSGPFADQDIRVKRKYIIQR